MTAAFILGQNINLAAEFCVRMDGTGLGQNLATLNFIPLNATKQCADVVASLGIVEDLAEHFDTGNNRLLLLVLQADDLNFLTGLQLAALNSTGGNGTASGNGEDVLNRHQEGLIRLAVRRRDIAINSIHQFPDALKLRSVNIASVILKSLQSRTADNRSVVAREFILVERLTDFHFNKLEQFRIVDLIALVHENDDIGHANLTGKQKVLLRLRHRAIGRRDNKDRAIHLRRAGDHVLDIVGMAGAVHVCIVAGSGLILNVSGVDRDAALALFRSLIDIRVINEIGFTLHCEGLGDRRRQSGLTMVDVANGTNVYMGFGSFEMLLCHWMFLLLS